MFDENLSKNIKALAYEKSIDVERVFKALEDALATAARKYYKTREPMETVIDRVSGEMTMYVIKDIVIDENEIEDPQAQWTLDQARKVEAEAEVGGRIRLSYITKEVVDVVKDSNTQIRTYEAQKIDPEVEQGDEVHIPLTKAAEDFGRIAAQSAKQVLYQKVREAEREKVYNEFIGKAGELENGYVKRFERGDMIIDLNGKTEGIIPRSQQSRAERYSQGDRIKAVIVDVHTQPKGPQVVLSRTDPRLLIKLFEMEVPEIYDGTVVIRGAVREPDDHRSVVDLRHFHLEELDEQPRIGTRENDLRPFRLRVHVDDDRLDAVALRVALGARLLRARDDPLGLAIEVDDHVPALEALDVTVLQLASLADEFVVHLLPLGLADLLVENLFGRLRGDAAEVLGGLRQRDVHFVALLDLGVDLLGFIRAELGVRVLGDVDHFLGDVAEPDPAADLGIRFDLPGLFECPLRLRVFDLVLVDDDIFDDVHRHLAADPVDDGLHRFPCFVVLARGGSEGILEGLEHALDVDRLLVRQRLDVFTEVLVEHSAPWVARLLGFIVAQQPGNPATSAT